MKIVLIYPPNNMHRVSYNLKTKKHRTYGHQPPLGLGYVAAIAEKEGHEVTVVDGVAHGYSIDKCADIVAGLNPDLIGLSVMTHVKNEAKMLASALKQRLLRPIIVGGTHAYYFHSDILKEMPDVDFVLYGEIENSWIDFLSKINSSNQWSSVAGLCYRDSSGNIKINEPPEIIENLDEIPLPSWHLYDFSLYSPLPFQTKGDSFFALISSRGCAYGKCAFCYQAGRQKQKYRRHSPQRIVTEMKMLQDNYGITDIAFWDDTFITDIKWLEEFSKLLKQESLRIHWTCSTKVSFLNKDKLRIMKDAGCWSIFLGIESGNDDLLKIIDKGITLEQAKNAVRWANEVGIETRCAYMLGLPGETPQKARKTIEFAKSLDSTYAIFYATHPRFGTKLYDIAAETGNFLSKDYNGMTGITYVPHGYKNALVLQKNIRNAYNEFYLRPHQIIKYIRKIHTLRDLRELWFALELFLGLKNK